MDSPYRQGELDVIQSSGREDKRCTDAPRVCSRLRRTRFRDRVALVGAWAGGLSMFLVGVFGVAAGARACLLLANMNPHPVLLRCTEPAPSMHAQRPSPPHLPRTMFDLPPANLLGATEPETHDPAVLALRALSLKAAGTPVNVQVVGIPGDALVKGLGFRVHATPVARIPGAAAAGMELATIPKGSLLERAGLLQGDVVLSVNGYNAAEAGWIDHVRADPGAATVVELLRAKQRVVLVVEWLH